MCRIEAALRVGVLHRSWLQLLRLRTTCKIEAEDTYRVMKRHRMPCRCGLFSVKEPYNEQIFCGKRPASYGIRCIFATLCDDNSLLFRHIWSPFELRRLRTTYWMEAEDIMYLVIRSNCVLRHIHRYVFMYMELSMFWYNLSRTIIWYSNLYMCDLDVSFRHSNCVSRSIYMCILTNIDVNRCSHYRKA